MQRGLYKRKYGLTDLLEAEVNPNDNFCLCVGIGDWHLGSWIDRNTHDTHP